MCCKRVVSQRCLLVICFLLIIIILCMLAASMFFDQWMKSERTSGYCSKNCTSIRLWRSCAESKAYATNHKFYTTEIKCLDIRKDIMQFHKQFNLDFTLIMLLVSGLFTITAFVVCAAGMCQRYASCVAALTAICLLFASLCCGVSIGFFEFKYNVHHFITPDRGLGLYIGWGTFLLQLITSIIAWRAVCAKPRIKACEKTVYGIQMRDASQPPPPVAPGYENYHEYTTMEGSSPDFADDFNQGPPGYEESVAGGPLRDDFSSCQSVNGFPENRYSANIPHNAPAPLMHGGYHQQQVEYAAVRPQNGYSNVPSYAESAGYASPYDI